MCTIFYSYTIHEQYQFMEDHYRRQPIQIDGMHIASYGLHNNYYAMESNQEDTLPFPQHSICSVLRFDSKCVVDCVLIIEYIFVEQFYIMTLSLP